MLSFLNSIPSTGNGKTGPTGNTVQSATTRDTTVDSTKTFCNGSPAGKKRKKGKQPASSATKVPKLTSAVRRTAPAKLEPVEVIIPKEVDKPLESEQKDVKKPTMASPLFKDIPSKRSAPVTSSSEGNSYFSDDCSSPDNDSADEEAGKKDSNTCNTSLEVETAQESTQLRIPIKLTISNLGKSSAAVISTAALNTGTISSHSDSEEDINDVEKAARPQSQLTSQRKANGNSDNPGANKLSTQHEGRADKPWKNSTDNYCKSFDNGQLERASKMVFSEKVVDELDDICSDVSQHNEDSQDNDDSLHNDDSQQSNTVLSLMKSDKSEVNSPAVNCPLPKKDNCGEEKAEDGIFTQKSSKTELKISTSEDIESRLTSTKHSQGELTSNEAQVLNEALTTSKEPLSGEDKNMKSKLDSESLQESCDTKYCSDGFLLNPALSKSPQNLQVNLNILQMDLKLAGTQDTKNTSSSVAETSSTNDKVTEIATLASAVNDCKQSSLDVKNIFPQGRELNIPTNNTSSQNNLIPDRITETIQTNKLTLPEKSHIKKVSDQNHNPNARGESDDENAEEYLASKSDEHPSETMLEKTPVDINKTVEAKCSDPLLLVPLVSKSAATKLTTSLTTTTTNSGSIMSSISETSPKTSGFTNGIPDSENPFITWTKYDDPNNGGYEPAPTSLPGLVHNLPFPLSLAVESSISHISPSAHVAVPQLSPLALGGLSPGSGRLSISPSMQMPMLSSPDSRRLKSSPSHSHGKQAISPHHIQLVHGCEENKASTDEDSTTKPAHKRKRTSRLSNIIDSLRTSKEKQAAGSSQIFEDQIKKGTLDYSAAVSKKSLSLESSSTGRKSSSSSPVFSVPLGSDHRLSSENLFCDNLGFPHQFGTNLEQVMRSNMDTARAHTIDKSFNVLKDDLDKGKRVLEGLETIRNGILDPYNKADSRSLKLDSSNSQSRSKSSSSSLFSPSSNLPITPSRPSSRQSTKSSSQIYPSASPLLPTSRSSNPITAVSNNATSGGSINSPMYHIAPSAALSAAHMELNAAAANILTFQHMYGMQDPYMMKSLISNPMYLQRMMEYQKQAMDPVMLRQIEMFEAAAAVENSKTSKEQQAAMNAHSILWQAHAASILQHQQMQQIQQLQLHHQQQQLQHQVAAARDRETRETIAAIITSNNLTSTLNKSSFSLSSGPSSKSHTASASTTLSTSSSSQSSSSKRPRSAATSSVTDVYSRDTSSLEMKLRASHQTSSHIPNHNNFNSSTPASLSLFRHASLANKLSNSSSNSKPHSSSSTTGNQPKHEYLNFPTAMQLSSVGSPHIWGFPAMLQPASLEMAQMAKFYEQANEANSLSLAGGSAESDSTGAEVLDLSVKPKT